MASDRFRKALSGAVKRAEDRQWVFGTLGRKDSDGGHTFVVPGRRGFVYVTIRQGNGAQTVVPARNDFGIEHRFNVGVRMKLEHGVYVVLGRANRSDLVSTPESPEYGVFAHAATHQHGGVDEIAVSIPAANAIPKADASGLLDDWVTPFHTQEEIEDFVAAQFVGNTGVIDATYDDGTGAITLTLDVSAADRYLYSTGADTWAEGTITSFARGLLDDNDAATMRSTLGLVIGTNVQAYDAELAAIAGLTSAADRLPYFTGSGTADLATFTAFGRVVAAIASASALRTELGITIYNTPTFEAAGDARYVLKSGDTMSGNLSILRDTGSQFTLDSYRSNVNQGIFLARSGRGTFGSPLVSANGDHLLRIVAQGYSAAAGGFVDSSAIYFDVDGTPDSGGDTTDMPGAITFWTAADGSSTLVERIRITNGGRLEIYDRIRAMSSSGIRLEDDGGNLGLLVEDGGTLYAENVNFSAFVRAITGTSSFFGGLALRAKTTNNMVDGFGVGLVYQIEDNAGVANNIGMIGAVRNGADNTGKLAGTVWVAGATNPVFDFAHDGAYFYERLHVADALAVNPGGVAGQTTNGSLSFNALTGGVAQFTFRRNDLNRWIWTMTADAESGSNAGTDFQLWSRTDAGSALDSQVIDIKRSTGNIGLGGSPDSTYKLRAYGRIGVRPGTSSGVSGVGGMLTTDVSTLGNVGAGEDTIASYAVPANTLAVNGQSIVVEAAGTAINTGNTKTLRLRFDGDFVAALTIPANASMTWFIYARGIRTGSTAMRWLGFLVCGNSTVGSTTIPINTGTAPTNFTASRTVAVTGEGVTSNDILCDSLVVEYADA